MMKPFGPIRRLWVNSRVGGYIVNSPPIAEKECLREFSRELRRGAIIPDGDQIGDNLWNFSKCNHIITIKTDPDIEGEASIVDLYRDIGASNSSGN